MSYVLYMYIKHVYFLQHEQELLWQSQADAEAEYRKKLEIELAKTKIPRLHPIRQHHDDLMTQFMSTRRGGTINWSQNDIRAAGQ